MRAQQKNTGPFLVGGKINLPWNMISYDLTARLFDTPQVSGNQKEANDLAASTVLPKTKSAVF